MGGKGDKSSSTPVVQRADTSETDSQMAMYAMMLSQMAANNQAQMQQTQMPSIQMPVVQKADDVDWTEKTKQLKSKMSADYNLKQNRRKTVTDTIHTSPLLDDETAPTTKSVLS